MVSAFSVSNSDAVTNLLIDKTNRTKPNENSNPNHTTFEPNQTQSALTIPPNQVQPRSWLSPVRLSCLPFPAIPLVFNCKAIFHPCLLVWKLKQGNDHKPMSFHKGQDIITRFWKGKKSNPDIDLRNSQHSSQYTLTQSTLFPPTKWVEDPQSACTAY